jgi:hypothetical protein
LTAFVETQFWLYDVVMPDNRGSYSVEEIREGFERFFTEHGHYPTAPEVDTCSYLPAAKQIQRRFGGLPALRKQLGFEEINFGIGKFRSAIASSRNKTGFAAERELEKNLITYFGEPFVHIERPIDTTGKRRFDFFVDTAGYQFGVDVFYSGNKRDIQKNVDLKINNYTGTVVPIYFVLANKEIPQELLDEIVHGKTEKPLPQNIKLITWQGFLELIETMRPMPGLG